MADPPRSTCKKPALEVADYVAGSRRAPRNWLFISCLALYPRRSGHVRGPGRTLQVRFNRRRARIGHSLLDLESAAQNVSRIPARENVHSRDGICLVRLSLRTR